MRWIAAMFLAACGTFAVAQNPEPATDVRLLEKLDELTERIDDLSDRIRSLEEELQEVREVAELPEHEKHQRAMRRRMEEDRRIYEGQQIRRLAAIELPPNADRTQINDYIRQVLDPSGGFRPLPDGPHGRMLAKVGPENLDLLIEALGTADGHATAVLLEAINLLVDSDKHKSLILENLPSKPRLISVVRQKGWTSEARPILLDTVTRGQSQLVGYWLDEIIGAQDPRTYPALIAYAQSTPIHAHTYKKLKDLPGIDLSAVVDNFWNKHQSGERDQFSRIDADWGRIGIEYGNVDALGWAIDMLSANDFDQRVAGFGVFDQPSARAFVLAYIDFMGTDEEIRAWYFRYKDGLKFDPVQKRFRANVGRFDAQTATAALAQGDAAALEWMIGMLDADALDLKVAGFGKVGTPTPRELLLTYLDTEGSAQEIKAWYYANRERLKFDDKKQKFKKPLF